MICAVRRGCGGEARVPQGRRPTPQGSAPARSAGGFAAALSAGRCKLGEARGEGGVCERRRSEGKVSSFH